MGEAVAELISVARFQQTNGPQLTMQLRYVCSAGQSLPVSSLYRSVVAKAIVCVEIVTATTLDTPTCDESIRLGFASICRDRSEAVPFK